MCGAPDSYEHYICHCDFGLMLSVRYHHLDQMHKWALTLPSPQQELTGAMLQMSRDEDGFRLVIGNWSTAQQTRIQTYGDGLSFSKIKKLLAQTTRRFYRMHQELF